jgi:hypothetical protein
MMTDTLMALI